MLGLLLVALGAIVLCSDLPQNRSLNKQSQWIVSISNKMDGEANMEVVD